MLRRPAWMGVLIGCVLVGWSCKPKAPSDGLDASLSCEGVTCSGHGTCLEGDGGPVCECESGYSASGLDCLPTVCEPNPCTDPPQPSCEDETHLRAWPDHGTCSAVDGAATCDYGDGQVAACPEGLVCLQGVCQADNQSPPTPGDLVITELMINPSNVRDKDGEWFEVVNVSDHVIDLVGLHVSDADANEFVVSAQSPINLGAGEYFVFGPNADSTTNGDVAVDYEYSGLMLNNNGDSLTLSFDGRTIDSVSYDDGTLYPLQSGASMSLDPGFEDSDANDDPLHWCAATRSYDAHNKGTPGRVNDACSQADPCNPNPCTEPPGAACQGDVASHPSLDPGTCSVDATGQAQCDYGVVTEDCTAQGEICLDGACITDPCDPNPCTEPPAASCQGDVASHPSLDPGTCTVDATGQGQCDYAVIIEDCSAQGESCVNGTCQAPARRPQAGDLVITEFMANPGAVPDIQGEWFEIKNVTNDSLDIQGMVLRDLGTDSFTLPSTGPIVIAPGAYFVMGNNADEATNGYVSLDLEYSGFTLGNNGDEILLEVGGVLIDEVDYGGTSGGPTVVAGHSSSLDPGFLDASSNDQGVHWCQAVSQIPQSTDYGTPGADNDPCQ